MRTHEKRVPPERRSRRLPPRRGIPGSLGARYSPDFGGCAQLEDDKGRLFTLYGRVWPGFEYEYQNPPDAIEPSVNCPELERVCAMVAECRWDDWFVSLVGQLAQELDAPLWVLDTDGRLWNADAIDVTRLVL